MDAMIQMFTRFEVGQTYQTRSACDHDCIFTVTVTARNGRFITFEQRGQLVRRMVKIHDGCETIRDGNYSMAPIFRADRKAA